jgi:EAL domain-containing protein (putative c-di-GMP-specific phosphodiesterase class I)
MVLHVILGDLGGIEHEYGHAVHLQVLDGLAEEIRRLPSSVLRSTDIVCLPEGGELGFVVFLDGPRSKSKELDPHTIQRVSSRLSEAVEKLAHKHVSGLLRHRPRVSVGHAVGIQTRRYAPERQIALLAHSAALSAKTAHSHRLENEKLRLQSILLSGSLSAVYQPIVHARTLQVAGYEALIRGPVNSGIETPARLFESAGMADLEWELDQACLKIGLLGSTQLPENMYLSVNVLPSTLHDEAFATEELPRLVHQAGLVPARVTIEVTEQSAISNLVRFREALAPLRQRGFRIALDDVGVAHANLAHIYELRPDVIKLDRSIVGDVFSSAVRQDLIASVLTLANRLESSLVAEGVERREDWECLRDLGVPFAQGYLFARPGPAFPNLVFPEGADVG